MMPIKSTSPNNFDRSVGIARRMVAQHLGAEVSDVRRHCAQPVERKIQPRLTGPVNGGDLIKVICFAQNPSAAMRGGFLRWDGGHRSPHKRGGMRKTTP